MNGSAVLKLWRQRASSRIKPRPRARPISEFARTLRLPDGPFVGEKWVPETEPAQRLWLEAVESGRWRRFVVVAPSQRGKTLSAILLPTLWAIAERRQSAAYVMPNLDKLSQNWDGKIKPAIEGSGFGTWLPKKGPGSKGGKPAVLTLRDPLTGQVAGRLYFMATGGKKETSKSSISPSVLAFDEADDAANAGEIELVFRRVESFGAGSLLFIASTVNEYPTPRLTHPILDMHAEGTRSRIGHLCPHCKTHTPIELENFDRELVSIICPNCKVVWSEADRHAALNGAVLLHSNPDAPWFSMLTTGIDYHWEMPHPDTGAVELLLPKIAAEFKRAKAAETRLDFSLMRTHMHKVWCRGYVEPEPEGVYSESALVANSSRSTYEKRMVPAWASFLVLTQDVQGDRHYWLLVAHGSGDRWAIVDWGYELLVPYGKDGKPLREPTPVDRVKVFDLIRDKANEGWQVEGGERRMRPVQRGVDCGFLPSEVVGWVQGNPAWKAVRGVGFDEIKHQTGGHEKYLPAEIRQTKALQAVKPPGWRVYWWRVDGDRFRRSAQASLMRDADQVASGMLPRGLKANDAIVLHLSAMQWIAPTEDGRKTGSKKSLSPYWFEKRSRHDWGDCLDYNLALALLHRHAPDARDEEPEPEPAPAPSSSSGWVDSVVDGRGGDSWINS